MKTTKAKAVFEGRVSGRQQCAGASQDGWRSPELVVAAFWGENPSFLAPRTGAGQLSCISGPKCLDAVWLLDASLQFFLRIWNLGC